MSRESHLLLITIVGVRQWISKGIEFSVRYDLVRAGHRNVPPVYKCFYNTGNQEYILVSTGTQPDGSVPDREISLWPGLLLRHHPELGDGTELSFDPQDQTISTWHVSNEKSGRWLSTRGRNLTEASS